MKGYHTLFETLYCRVTVPPVSGGDPVTATVTANGQESASSSTVVVDYLAPAISGPIATVFT